jgi:hypothetical protein
MAVLPSLQLCLFAARLTTSIEEPVRGTGGPPPDDARELLLLAEEVEEIVLTTTTAATARTATPPITEPTMTPRPTPDPA